jgi:hypothetical protein
MKTSVSLLIGSVGLVALATSACSPKKGSDPIVVTTGGTSSTGGGGGTGVGGGADPAGGGSGLGNTIAISNVWIDKTGNSVGIQGAFFVLEDGVKDGAALSDGLPHSDFTADVDPLEEAGVSKFSDTSTPCISGTAAMVMAADGVTECGFAAGDEECNFDSTWGGGIGLNLNETGGEESVKSSFNASAAGITGFKFDLSGDVGGATVRFKAVPTGVTTDFCKTVTAEFPGTVSVNLADILSECWADGGIPVDTTAIESLQWQIVTDNKAPHTVANFCVSNLEWF